MYFPVFLAATHVPELHVCKELPDGVVLGAGLTLVNMQIFLEGLCKTKPVEQASPFILLSPPTLFLRYPITNLLCHAPYCSLHAHTQTYAFAAILENLRWFAGPQIRSVATLGGNIATATSISDLNPIWIAARATVRLNSVKGV